MVSVVICDDDRVARGAISVVCEDLGLEVVAETDQWTASLELAKRFEVDLMVLDITLLDGSGEHVLQGLDGVTSAPRVVVFSAFAHDVGRLKRLGAAEVVEKPNFTRLGEVLAELMNSAPVEPPAPEQVSRRVGSRSSSPLPTVWRSPSGIAPHHELAASLEQVVERDSVLAVALIGVDDWAESVGPRLVVDCHLAVGRMLALAVRAQDIVHEEVASGGFIALLRGGDGSAGPAVERRLRQFLADSSVPGGLVVAYTVVDGRGAVDAVARVKGELLS